jgi:hypothetical protein
MMDRKGPVFQLSVPKRLEKMPIAPILVERSEKAANLLFNCLKSKDFS